MTVREMLEKWRKALEERDSLLKMAYAELKELRAKVKSLEAELEEAKTFGEPPAPPPPPTEEGK